jgi:hypothetical protein
MAGDPMSNPSALSSMRSPRRLLAACAAVGLVVGALLVPPVAARVAGLGPTPKTAGQTRTTTCGAMAFKPIDSGVDYVGSGSGKYLYRSGAAFDSTFICPVELPDRAVVTKVQFTLFDSDASQEVSFCNLHRNSITVATAGNPDVMASVTATGAVAKPGLVRRTDTSIAFATIHNASFSYQLECALGLGIGVGIYGATVSYTISAANG